MERIVEERLGGRKMNNDRKFVRNLEQSYLNRMDESRTKPFQPVFFYFELNWKKNLLILSELHNEQKKNTFLL